MYIKFGTQKRKTVSFAAGVAVFACLAVTFVTSLGVASAGDVDDGITVRPWRQFDEFTLEQMLQNAQQNLTALNPIISSSTLQSQIGAIQGSTANSSGFGLNLGGAITATSGLSTTLSASRGITGGATPAVNSSAAAGITPSSASTVTINAPTVTFSSSPSSSGLQLSARDLLSDSVDLTFDVANLAYMLGDSYDDVATNLAKNPTFYEKFAKTKEQLILVAQQKVLDADAKLTLDKSRLASNNPVLLQDEAADLKARQDLLEAQNLVEPAIYNHKVVLGMSVALHPSAAEKNKLAEVRFHLDGIPGLSIRYLSPAKDTYNVLAVSNRTTNIGFAIPIAPIPVGFGVGSNNGTAYLVKDVDTVGYVTGPGGPAQNGVDFVWRFRPVLGRSFVSPGVRNVYIVLSVPEEIDGLSGASRTLVSSCKTTWRSIDPKTGLVNSSNEEEKAFHTAPDEQITLLGRRDVARYLAPFIDPVEANTDTGGPQENTPVLGALKIGPDEDFVCRRMSGTNLHAIQTVYINSAAYSVTNTPGLGFCRATDGQLLMNLPASSLPDASRIVFVGPYGSTSLKISNQVGFAGDWKVWADSESGNVLVRSSKSIDNARLLLNGRWYDLEASCLLTDLFLPPPKTSSSTKPSDQPSGSASSNPTDQSKMPPQYKLLRQVGPESLIVAIPQGGADETLDQRVVINKLGTATSLVGNQSSSPSPVPYQRGHSPKSPTTSVAPPPMYLVLTHGATTKLFRITTLHGPCKEVPIQPPVN